MQTNLGLIYGSPFRYNTTTLLDHFCMPNGSDYMNDQTYAAFKEAFF
jgi:hypothetical protein